MISQRMICWGIYLVSFVLGSNKHIISKRHLTSFSFDLLFRFSLIPEQCDSHPIIWHLIRYTRKSKLTLGINIKRNFMENYTINNLHHYFDCTRRLLYLINKNTQSEGEKQEINLIQAEISKFEKERSN